jgi:predicted deacylase
LIPRVDVVIDIHSGGRGHHFLESATMTWSADKKYRSDLVKNLNGWNTRYSLIFPSHPGTNEQSLLPGYVASLGKSLFTGEFGGSGITTATSNRITRAALVSALKSVSLLKPDFQSKGYDHQLEIAKREFIDMRSSATYHWAEEEGLYQNRKRLGEKVEKGEVIGAIHFPESADRKPHLVLAARSGTVGVIRGYPRVKRGDCLMLIGDSYSDLSQLPE